MPLRVRPGAFVSLCRISATSEWKLFIDFSSAQPDNVKQRGISLFKFSNSFKVSSHYTTCYLEKKSQYRHISITFHIKYVPIFSSSHILFPNKRQQNCLIMIKTEYTFSTDTYSVSVLLLKALVQLLKLKLAKSSLPLCYVERNLTSSQAEKY